MIFWHGGKPRIKGLILPADHTGHAPLKDYVPDREDADHVRTDKVFITNDRKWAEFFAAWYPAKSGGWVYEVEPIGSLEPDPDWRGLPGDWSAPNPSFMVDRAKVIRAYTISRADVARLRDTMNAPFSLVPR